jgi:6-phosphofructokinase 1
MKILAVVSGGDAPGINAALWQAARRAAIWGDSMVGAQGGLPGALAGQMIALSATMLMPWAGRAGSILPSSREPALARDGARALLLNVIDQHQIDAVMLFGGDGTLRHVLPLLGEWGVRCIGIPTTIDNDVPGTEYTLGFDSACNYAYQAVDGVLATAHALIGRIFMIETLGGNTGYLALAVAHGAGAHAVLLPEYDFDPIWLGERLKAAVERDGCGLVVLSEGVKAARTLFDDLPKWTGIRARDVRLGHAQRGSAPTHRDRVMASEMAALAYDALKDGAQLGVTVVKGGKVILHEGALSHAAHLPPNEGLYRMINGL